MLTKTLEKNCGFLEKMISYISERQRALEHNIYKKIYQEPESENFGSQ